MLHLFRTVLALATVFALNVAAQVPSFSETNIFISGVGGYNTYRIPSIVRSTNGTLLAFCEGRKTSSSDSGDIDIVLRRSTNNGASWLPMSLVQEEGGTTSITIGNPTAVVDETTGEIHLLFCRNNDRVFRTVSSDDGVTWSARVELTSQVKLSDWGWYATGPGHGVQLKRGAQAGRLVIPCDYNTTNGGYGNQIVYSDDHGATWLLGAIRAGANNINPNENEVVELVATAPGGGSRLYCNSRDQNGSASGNRSEAWSLDSGSSYGPFTNNTYFVCPVVQGSLLRLRATDEGAGRNRVLFSCPNNGSSRVNISVWSSTNEAASWSSPKSIYSSQSAYSDLVRDAAGDCGLLCEEGVSSAYENITYFHFNEAWLDAAPPATENPVPAFWNFEEKSAGAACSTNAGAILDISPAGFANNITAQSPFLYTAGPTNFGSGAALQFDGTGGLQMSDAATSNHFDFATTNSFTIEVVFRVPFGSSQVGALVAKDYGAKLPSWWLRVESGKARFLVADTQIEPNISTTNLVNDGNWHHVAAIRDATNPTNKFLRLYLDGVLSNTGADGTTENQSNAQPLNIGRFGASSTRNLTGEIDMVRITPRVLAPSEFLDKYTQFDADNDLIPDTFERSHASSLSVLGIGDADHDGWLDLLEYALGSDPLGSNSMPQFTVTPSATSVVISTPQRSLAPWLGLRLESSENLTSWTQAAGTPVITPLGGELYSRAQTVPYPSGTPPRLFFRFSLYQTP